MRRSIDRGKASERTWQVERLKLRVVSKQNGPHQSMLCMAATSQMLAYEIPSYDEIIWR